MPDLEAEKASDLLMPESNLFTDVWHAVVRIDAVQTDAGLSDVWFPLELFAKRTLIAFEMHAIVACIVSCIMLLMYFSFCLKV